MGSIFSLFVFLSDSMRHLPYYQLFFLTPFPQIPHFSGASDIKNFNALYFQVNGNT